MERIFERDFILRALLPAIFVVFMALALVVIAYGFDTVANGVHDTFHDFRHVIGMPCH